MRKYLTLFIGIAGAFVLSFGISSCEGPAGPPGPEGPAGEDGADGLIGTIFEAEVDFDASNEYSTVVEFPSEIEVFTSDVVIAYILTAVDDGTDIWEPLPQTLFFDTDILLYGYDHTSVDIRFFLDGTINLDALEPIFTDDVIFRVAIIPAEFSKDIDVNNLKDVMNALSIDRVERLN